MGERQHREVHGWGRGELWVRMTDRCVISTALLSATWRPGRREAVKTEKHMVPAIGF